MKAVSNYKAMINEVGKMVSIFANFKEYHFKDSVKEQGWTLDYIDKIQGKVQASTIIPEQIKEELIGDGKKAEFTGRLKTAFFELNSKPSFAPSYFSEFNEACFSLPLKDDPDRNRELIDALMAVYGKDASVIMVKLESICQTTNYIVHEICSMFDEVCKFVGYNQEPQQGEMPKELMTPEARVYFEKAIELGLMDANNNWLKGWQMLACFAREMSLKLKLGKGERIAWKPFETLFCVPKGKLRLNYNDIQKTGQAPQEVYLIDKVFE